MNNVIQRKGKWGSAYCNSSAFEVLSGRASSNSSETRDFGRGSGFER